jgi:hypothetical protein
MKNIYIKNIYISNFLTTEERNKLNIESMIIDRNNFINTFYLNKVITHTWIDKDMIKFINPLIKLTKMVNDDLEVYKIALSKTRYSDKELLKIITETFENEKIKNIWIEKETLERIKKIYPEINDIIEQNNLKQINDLEKQIPLKKETLEEIIGWYVGIVGRIYLKEKYGDVKNENYKISKKLSGPIQMHFEINDDSWIKKYWNSTIKDFRENIKKIPAYKKFEKKEKTDNLINKLEDLFQIYEENFLNK